MRRHLAASPLILFAAIFAGPGLAQTTDPLVPPSPNAGRHVAATGKVMPPPGSPGTVRPSVADEMAKAQKAADTRNKAWDSKMRKTMGSICSGC